MGCVCRQTCTDAFNFVLFILFIRSATTNTEHTRIALHMANRLPSLSFAIYTIHFHSRIYDIFSAAVIPLSHVLTGFVCTRSLFPSTFFSLSISLSLSLSRSLTLDISFNLSWFSSFFYAILGSVLCTLIHWHGGTWTLCAVQPAMMLPFLLCECVFFVAACHIFLTAKNSSHFSFMCAFLFAVRLFVLYHVVVVLSFGWFKLKLEYETATATATHSRSSNVYQSTTFSFWCFI